MAVRRFSTAKEILRFEGLDAFVYWRRFAMLLSLATVIATMGLIRDSGAVVIAAMLVAPLMTPILGIAAAMVSGRSARALRLIAIVALASLLCVALAWLLIFLSDVPRGILIPGEVRARTDPGIEDLVVALAAGVAGAYVQINKSELSLLPGAAIGVSLVPPLCAAGILLYFGEPADAYEAGLLYVTNLFAIILSASIVYIASGALPSIMKTGRRRARFTITLGATVLLLSLVVVQLGIATVHRFQATREEARLAQAIKDWADPVSVEIFRVSVRPRQKTADVWFIVDLPIEAQNRIGSVADMIPEQLKERPLLVALQNVLGDGFSVVVRYQTRLAGLASLATGDLTDAPAYEEPDEEADD